LMEVAPQVETYKNCATKKKVAKKSTEAKTAIRKQHEGKENIGAARQPEPSPLNTKESSPTTPNRKPKAKRVTPIPSLVIADGKIQVSPLPTHDRPRTKVAARPLVARRGLFEATDDSSAQRDQRLIEAHAVIRKEAAPVKTTPKVSRVAIPKAASKRVVKKDGAVDDGSFSDLDMLKISRRKPNCHNRKAPPKPILEFPRQNKTSKAARKMTSVKPLKEIYDEEVKKATNFVNDVVGTRKDGGKPLAPKESLKIPQKRVEKTLPDDRYREFLTVFRDLRMKAEEGTIEESLFRKLVNERSTTGAFSDGEINTHLEKLCDDGKVMRSSGTLYIID